VQTPTLTNTRATYACGAVSADTFISKRATNVKNRCKRKKNTMIKRICKIELLKNARKAERKKHAAMIDWHLRRISEAHKSGNKQEIERHEAKIQEFELRLHQK
jgi:hypothetical protein